jgi:type I restriction enzyme, S subunit
MTNLPHGWDLKSLSSLVTLLSGFAYKSSDWKESGVPVLKITNVRNGIVRLEGCSYISKERATESKQFAVHNNDLLITMTGEIGATGFYREEFEARLNQRVGKLVVKEGEPLNLKYLAYFFESPETRQEMWKLAKGIAQANISPKEILNLKIPLPPLPEQRKIVEALEDHLSRLDKVQHEMDCASARLDQLNLALLDKFFYQHDNLPGDRIQVGNLGKWITGSTPSSKNPDFVGTDFPFVTPGDVGRGGEISHVARTISNKGADSVRKIAPKAIQLVCIGATLGKVGITNFPCATNQQINSLQVDTSILVPEYGMWLFASPEFQQQLWTASSTTTVPNLNKGKLEKLTVRIPSIRDQVEILERFNFTTPLRERAKETITEYGSRNQSLKRSLLHAAFTGQLTNEVDIV